MPAGQPPQQPPPDEATAETASAVTEQQTPFLGQEPNLPATSQEAEPEPNPAESAEVSEVLHSIEEEETHA